MQRFIITILIILNGGPALAQNSLAFKSPESLALGAIIDRYSLIQTGECKVDRVLFSPDSITSDGQFSQPIKSENLLTALEDTEEVNYEWLYLIREHALKGTSGDPRAVTFQFNAGLKGPHYEAEVPQDCLLDSDREGLVTDLDLSAQFQLQVKVIFKTLQDKHRALNFYKLSRTNLFSLFLKMEEMDLAPIQLTLGLRQTGGDMRKYMDLVDSLEEQRVTCMPGHYSPCQSIVTKLYEYIFSDQGLEKQLLNAHQEAEEIFSSTGQYRMEISDEMSEYSVNLQSEVKALMIALLKTHNILGRIAFNQLSFNQSLAKKVSQRLRANIGLMDLNAEHCLENWDNCDLSWSHLEEQLEVIDDDEWIEVDFIKACQLDSNHPFFISLTSKFKFANCVEMWNFLKAKSTLDARDLGMWSVHYLKYFPNIKSIDLRNTSVMSLDGLEYLPILTHLSLSKEFSPDYAWLQILNPDLLVQED